MVLNKTLPVSGINSNFDACAYYIIRFFKYYSGYLFPDFSGDEWRIDDYHIECAMKLSRNFLRLIEVVEDKTRVLVKLLIELYQNCQIIKSTYIENLRVRAQFFVLK